MSFDDTYRMSVHAVIVDDERQVLQLKATYGDRGWGLPGGAVEPGETVHETLERECLEELGVAIDIGALTGVYYHSVFSSHVLIFRCTIPRDATIRLSEEHDQYRFFPLDELSEVQRRRVGDCLGFDGRACSARF